jgi:hypothetical protein
MELLITSIVIIGLFASQFINLSDQRRMVKVKAQRQQRR